MVRRGYRPGKLFFQEYFRISERFVRWLSSMETLPGYRISNVAPVLDICDLIAIFISADRVFACVQGWFIG